MAQAEITRGETKEIETTTRRKVHEQDMHRSRGEPETKKGLPPTSRVHRRATKNNRIAGTGKEKDGSHQG